MSCAGIAAHSVSSEVSAHQISQQSEQQLQKWHPGAYSEVDGEGAPKPLAAPLASTKLLRQLPPDVEAPFSTTAAAGNSNLVMSVLCRGKTSASSRRLRQCVSHTKSPFIQPAQSFDEAVDVPVALHDRQKAVSSTGPVHWQDRRFPSCVATPSTNNPDDTAKVLRVRQRQSTTNQEIQKIVETTQRQTSHHRFRSSRKSRRLPRYHKLYRDSADHPTIQNAVKIPQAQFSTGSQWPQLGSNAKHQPSRAHSSRWRSLRLII